MYMSADQRGLVKTNIYSGGPTVLRKCDVIPGDHLEKVKRGTLQTLHSCTYVAGMNLPQAARWTNWKRLAAETDSLSRVDLRVLCITVNVLLSNRHTSLTAGYKM